MCKGMCVSYIVDLNHTFHFFFFFFFNDTPPTEIYTLPLHAALPICSTTAGGVLAGAHSPNQDSCTASSLPSTSCSVGTSGSCARRLRLVTARARSLPPRTWGMPVPATGNARSEEHTSGLQSPCNLAFRP